MRISASEDQNTITVATVKYTAVRTNYSSVVVACIVCAFATRDSCAEIPCTTFERGDKLDCYFKGEIT